MKAWFLNLAAVAFLGGASIARAADCPAALDFHKYLLDRQGRVVASFPSQVDSQDERLIEAIEALL